MMANIVNNQILKDIRNLLISSREKLQQSVNTVMVQTYWQIGKLIIEDELGNLRKMRQFFLTFPIQDSVSLKLSRTHYRGLMRIESQQARERDLLEVAG